MALPSAAPAAAAPGSANPATVGAESLPLLAIAM